MNHEGPGPIEKKTPNAEEYNGIEAAITAKRAELSTSSIDRMSELVTEIQQLESQKTEAFDSAHDEAHEENNRMDAESVAFDTTQEEATVENARLDQEKALETERIGKINQDVVAERARLSGASAEELGNIVRNIKALEAQKVSAPENAINGQGNEEEPEMDLTKLSDEELSAERVTRVSKIEVMTGEEGAILDKEKKDFNKSIVDKVVPLREEIRSSESFTDEEKNWMDNRMLFGFALGTLASARNDGHYPSKAFDFLASKGVFTVETLDQAEALAARTTAQNDKYLRLENSELMPIAEERNSRNDERFKEGVRR